MPRRAVNFPSKNHQGYLWNEGFMLGLVVVVLVNDGRMDVLFAVLVVL
jgi:hypothetical protein